MFPDYPPFDPLGFDVKEDADHRAVPRPEASAFVAPSARVLPFLRAPKADEAVPLLLDVVAMNSLVKAQGVGTILPPVSDIASNSAPEVNEVRSDGEMPEVFPDATRFDLSAARADAPKRRIHLAANRPGEGQVVVRGHWPTSDLS